jgi:hypothetical protein
MSKKFRRSWQSCLASIFDSLAKFQGVPKNNDSSKQIQARDPMVLAFGSAVTDFTSSVKVDGLFQGVMGFPFVQTDPRSALHASVHDQVDHEECSFNPADLPQSNGQLVLSGIRGKFSQDLAWWHNAGSHCGSNP